MEYTAAQLTWLEGHGYNPDENDGDNAILAWQEEHETLAPHGLGIPCDCNAGLGCSEPATIYNDAYICAGCDEGAAWDADTGDSDCACCGDSDMLMWDPTIGGGGAYVYCGAAVDPVPDGPYALWWTTTTGDDDHLIDRYATEEAAESEATRRGIALHAKHRGDLLCGYEVRAA